MLKVILLGTGCPTPQPHRYGSAYLVQVGEEVLMFDCGPGATQRIAASPVRLPQIDYLWFTHHHFDHTADYPAFYLSRWDQGAGKAKPLQVFGPPGTERFTQLLFGPDGAFMPDIMARTRHPASLNAYRLRGGVPPRSPPEVRARDIHPGPVQSGKDYEVSAAPALHFQPYLDSLAYRIDSSEGSVVITGDTGPCVSVLHLARGADLLVVCVAGSDDRPESPELWHSGVGPSGAARMAAEAGVKKLVLVHLTEAFNRPEVLADAVAAAQRIFPREVVTGSDLLEIAVSSGKEKDR